MSGLKVHSYYMALALEAAERAGQNQEVPIGAVVVAQNGNILATGYNQPISKADPTAHAEIMALRSAARKLKNYRLVETTLYVTIEPCPMCMGAILNARVERLVYGAADPKWGAAGSLFRMDRDERLNHRVEVVSGILESRCRTIIQDFFKTRRGH